MSTPSLKSELRSQALSARKNAHSFLAPLAPHLISSAFFAHILKILPPISSLTISAYIPINTEINPLPLLHTLHLMGAKTALPIITQNQHPLSFAPYSPGDTLHKGPFNTLQPSPSEILSPSLIITPLLAFDNNGFRLGYGGGFYDRTLPQHPLAFSLGIAYDQQLSPNPLPLFPSDVPLNAIITPQKTLFFPTYK